MHGLECGTCFWLPIVAERSVPADQHHRSMTEPHLNRTDNHNETQSFICDEISAGTLPHHLKSGAMEFPKSRNHDNCCTQTGPNRESLPASRNLTRRTIVRDNLTGHVAISKHAAERVQAVRNVRHRASTREEPPVCRGSLQRALKRDGQECPSYGVLKSPGAGSRSRPFNT